MLKTEMQQAKLNSLDDSHRLTSELAAKLFELKSQVSDAEQTNASLERELSAMKAQIEDGERARERLEGKLDASQTEMDAQLADAEQQRSILKVGILVLSIDYYILGQ